MIPNIILAGVMLVALILYALLGGADFGAGFWDLLCSGPRRDNQRRLIAEAIHPVWETNHVWLILLIVLMFSGFPPAFSSIAIGLAVPMFLILLGIVLRGASYVFRAYSESDERMQLHWGRIFSISSSVTPLFLGIVIGAISCNATFVKGPNQNGLLRTWYQPFPLLVGVLSLSLFAYLAACYLTLDADTDDLKNDFRNRALFSGFISVLAAFATYIVAGSYAQQIRDGLSRTPFAWLIELAAALSALVAYHALWVRRYQRARLASGAQVALIILGWGIAQYPFLVRPEITIFNGAAPSNILVSLETVTALGAVILLPSLLILLLIFKRHRKSLASTGGKTT
jgi:cytochrome bd ubiquinol oxidase subunit II